MASVIRSITGLLFIVLPLFLFSQDYKDTTIIVPYKFTVTRTVSGERKVTTRLPIIHDTIYIFVTETDTIYIRDTICPEVPLTPDTCCNDFYVNVREASAYLKWDTVPGALWYEVYKDGKLMTEITGNDTWDVLDETVEYYIIPKDTIGTKYDTIKASATWQGDIGVNIQGDYRRIDSISVRGGVVISPKFVQADIGKVIGIAGTRKVDWYRIAPLWGHYNITNVLEDGSAVLSGNPLDVENSHGWYATNRYAEFRYALEEGAGIFAYDTVYVDGPTISVDKPQMVTGNFVFGREDMINESMVEETPKYTVIDHKAGVLRINGSIRGPLTVPLRNQANRASLIFYKRNTETKANCELHFSGVFGDSLNYRSGFVNFAQNTHGTADSGKDVIGIYHSRIFCSEPFELRPYSTNLSSGTVTPDWGKRMILRDVYFGGSAFVKFVGPVRGTIEGNRITIDSTLHPDFTFRELYNILPWSQYVIYKKPEEPPGPMNQFENSLIKQTQGVKNRYSVEVQGNTLAGDIDLLATSDMQPTIPWEGHLLYTHAACELEAQYVHIHGIRSLFVRASDAPEFKGQFHRQLSINHITWSASDDASFDAINAFGGYVQFKIWPQPFYELQSGMKNPGIIFYNNAQKYQGGPPLIIRP